jgi:6,7-dimethyl-8-ribityllumazine synthase
MNHLINTSESTTTTTLLPDGKKIGFIRASWHQDIVDQSLFSFTDGMVEHGIDKSRIDVFNVPGSLEIPLQAKLLAKSGNYAVVVAAGLIVDGGIYRHDFVAATVLNAMMDVQLELEIPILSMVLTPHNFSEATEHQEFFFEHFKKKGIEAARACAQTLVNTTAARIA